MPGIKGNGILFNGGANRYAVRDPDIQCCIIICVKPIEMKGDYNYK